MAKAEKSKQGCFSSGFIRVLLCAGNGTSPPVHPSDETEFVQCKKDSIFEDNNAAIATTPGLVARLMGLESLPKTNFVVKGATPDSVPRSRSVNFVDYMVNFDVAGKSNNHRRAMTSSSFREVPVPVPVPAPVPALANMGQENENDLVVFCWDGDECKEHEAGFGKKLREFEVGLEELKQGKKQGKKQGNKNKNKNKEIISVKKERNNNNNNSQGKSKKISKLKNEPRRVPYTNNGKKGVRIQREEKGFSSVSSSSKSSSSCSCNSSKLQNNSNKQKKEFVEESSHTRKMRKQKLPKKMMESECNSENQITVFLDGISSIASKSKWKSSPLISISDNVENSSIKNKGFGCAYTDIIHKEAEYYSELLMKIQTLTQHDIREFDYCTTKHIYEYEEFEEICFSFEHKILDLLLHEVVNEAVELCC